MRGDDPDIEEIKEENSIEISDQDEEKESSKTCYVKFELGIQDFGCGISPDQLNKLFINFNNLEEHR
jgi:signal transduction histidine kinase